MLKDVPDQSISNYINAAFIDVRLLHAVSEKKTENFCVSHIDFHQRHCTKKLMITYQHYDYIVRTFCRVLQKRIRKSDENSL